MPNERETQIEDEIKAYDREISINWKKQTHKMLEAAKGDAEEFRFVLEKMVGAKGSVARTLAEADHGNFFAYMYEHYDDICHGVLDIFSVSTAAGLANNPLSYITKICHIINPNAYPLIWDTNVRKQLGIGESKNRFRQKVDEIKPISQTLKREEAYTRESKLWAGETTEWQ